MNRRIPSFVLEDCKRICEGARGHIRQIALFGSTINRGFELANDIDLACFVEGMALEKVTRMLLATELTRPKRIGSANGGYTAARPKGRSIQQDYHIILLEDREPNPVFMQMNSGRMHFIDLTPHSESRVQAIATQHE